MKFSFKIEKQVILDDSSALQKMDRSKYKQTMLGRQIAVSLHKDEELLCEMLEAQIEELEQ